MVARLDGLKSQMAEVFAMLVAYSVWNDDGAGVVTGIYESEAVAEAAVAQIRAIWGGLERLLTAALETQTFSNVEKMC